MGGTAVRDWYRSCASELLALARYANWIPRKHIRDWSLSWDNQSLRSAFRRAQIVDAYCLLLAVSRRPSDLSYDSRC